MITQQYDALTLALVIIGGVFAHLLLFGVSRWVNPVVGLMAAFFILAPVSAMLIPGAELFKFARLYVNLLAIVVSIFALRRFQVSGVGLAFFCFILFYVLAGLWSDSPLNAVTFKGLLLPAVAAGLLAAVTIRTTDDLRAAMRVFLVVSLAFAVPMFINLMSDPLALARGGRFAPWGLNSNRLGHEVASMLIACSVVALYDPSKRWKTLAYVTGTMLAAGVLTSGSRAAAGEAAIAAVVLGIPLSRRPLLPITLGLVSAGILYVLMPAGTDAVYDRYAQINFESRMGEWAFAFSQFQESPIIGQGWIYDPSMRAGGSTANLHSMYMQVLAETGLVGVLLMACLLAYCLLASIRLVFQTKAAGVDQRWVFCALAFCAGPLAHGLGESSSIQGSSINIIMMSFGFGLFAPLSAMAKANRGAADERGVGGEWELGRYEDNADYGDAADPDDPGHDHLARHHPLPT